jgi:transaldolase
MMNQIQALHKYGQSIWLDFISRSLLTGGGLKQLVEEGVTGVTSNPSIFQKSICETEDYSKVIQATLKSQPGIKTSALYEKIAVEDIQMAADILRPVYETSGGTDGFVSFEVSPNLAYATSDTVSEAQRLWHLVNRPNLMIKVPATGEGIPAIESLIAQGININATLIFSLSQYEAVAYAYIQGLGKNPDPQKVASVASFFVSRIDTTVDKSLEKTGIQSALELQGKIAVSYTKMIYKKFKEIFYGTSFDQQRQRGARVQRMVWGSTGTKNPKYSDILYVNEIIGPDTINTLPMPTLKAFLDHGQPGYSLQEEVEAAKNNIAGLKKYNIDINSVTDQLQKDGVQAFIQAYNQMLDSLSKRYNVA